MTSRKVTQEDIDYWCRIEVYPDGSVGQGSTDLKVGDDYPKALTSEQLKTLVEHCNKAREERLRTRKSISWEPIKIRGTDYEHQEKDKT